jgi:phage FluMu protein Com
MKMMMKMKRMASSSDRNVDCTLALRRSLTSFRAPARLIPMAFTFKCTHCGQLVEARNDQVGVSIPCPNCKTFVLVPSPEAGTTQGVPGARQPPPAPPRGPANNFVVLILGLLSAIYLFNPTAGFLELIPDNIPIIGNLDEIGATLLLLRCLSHFGINLDRFIKAANARRSRDEDDKPQPPPSA